LVDFVKIVYNLEILNFHRFYFLVLLSQFNLLFVFIILFVFGAHYEQSILPFQILVFGFWIVATFRTINGNILASLGRAKMAMWLNIVIVTINIVLTYILVKNFGMVGAAVGIVIVYVLAGSLATIALNRILGKG
jgi:O-antigen/teichoic acid export membrane protein